MIQKRGSIVKLVYRTKDQWYNIIILDQEDQDGKNWDLKSEIQDCELSDQTLYYYFLTIVSVRVKSFRLSLI